MTHYVEINDKTMRQPTNLELAQLLTLQSSLVICMNGLSRVSNDLLAEPEQVHEAEKLVQTVMASIARFWAGLMLEEVHEHEVPD